MAEDEGFDLHFLPLQREKIMVSFPSSRERATLREERCIWIGSNPHIHIKQNSPPGWVSCFVLAEDEGFEPPRTESESGVLPLH